MFAWTTAPHNVWTIDTPQCSPGQLHLRMYTQSTPHNVCMDNCTSECMDNQHPTMFAWTTAPQNVWTINTPQCLPGQLHLIMYGQSTPHNVCLGNCTSSGGATSRSHWKTNKRPPVSPSAPRHPERNKYTHRCCATVIHWVRAVYAPRCSRHVCIL
jgi:hypothetical protein